MRYYGSSYFGFFFKKRSEWWFDKAGSFRCVNMLSLGRITFVWNFKRWMKR